MDVVELKENDILVVVSSLVARKHAARFSLQEKDLYQELLKSEVLLPTQLVSFLIAIGNGIFIAVMG